MNCNCPVQEGTSRAAEAKSSIMCPIGLIMNCNCPVQETTSRAVEANYSINVPCRKIPAGRLMI